MRLIALLITLFFMLCAYSASEHAAPNADLPLVEADYAQRCVPVPLGPFRSQRLPTNPYQRERGIA